MNIGGLNFGHSDDDRQEQSEQSANQPAIDLEKLARKIYEKLIRELEIENERLGQA